MSAADKTPPRRALPLARLAAALGLATEEHWARIDITGVTADTRALARGEMYVALPGDHVDGARFVPDAVARGAAAVVVERRFEDCPVPVLVVPDTRAALSRASAEYWDHPSRALTVVGITGTDGKTTTTYLANAVLEAGGHSTGFVTTVDIKIGWEQRRSDERITTPQPPALQRLLQRMVDAGNEYAVIETSSHALRLHRVADVAFDVAVLTNVTSEHLELHGTVERYRLDKARLFSMVGEGKGERGKGKGADGIWGIINADDPNADLFERASAGRTLTYGTSRWADVVAEGIEQGPDGLGFRLHHAGAVAEVRLPMLGAYNVYNALAAACVGISQGVPLDRITTAFEGFAGVPGRMQRIDEGQPFAVVVDYAHTAASLEKVLRVLRTTTAGRLLSVFGSAGERDRPKRAAMGRVAARQADFALLTDEDPRGEDRECILAEIAQGLEEEGARLGERYLAIPDRRGAIAEAFARASAGDAVLLAGKGHESSIQYADHALPWDEAAVARELLRSR